MKLLTNRTADKIRQRVLDISPPIADDTRTIHALGGRPVFVRCTSATAAAGSGVGAQCYPGVIVDPRASATSQTERGTVWLTLLGAGGVAKQPKTSLVYECLLTGDVEAATSDTRPRAFSVTGSASTSSDCSGVLGLIRAGTCLSMSITETSLGACDCIDDGQTADLTWDADESALTSEDLLYGCPPGVITTICDGELNTGGPKKWNIVVAGFGAPNENLNQSYTVTHTTGEIWVGVKNGVTVTATRTLTGWTLSLDDGDVTVTYDSEMAFCCQTITFDILDDDGTTTAPATLDMTVATACGNGPGYTPRLERVNGDCGLCLKFTWVPVVGSGSRSIPWKQVGCGEDADGLPYVEFATDDPLICTGTDGDDCIANKVVVRLTCASCVPMAAGWYCYKGISLEPICQYLTEDPRDGGYPWAGPFETEEECDCLSPPLCCPEGFPLHLCVSLGSLSSYPELGSQSFEVAYAEVIRIGQSTGGGITCENYGTESGPGWVFCREYDNDLGGNQWTTVSLLPCQGGVFAVDVRGWNGSSEISAGGVTDPVDACDLPLAAPLGTGPVSFGSIDATIGEAEDDCGPISRTWNCIPGTGCVELFDGSGEYPTFLECVGNCGGGGGGGGGPTGDCGFDCTSGVLDLEVVGGDFEGTFGGTSHCAAIDYWMIEINDGVTTHTVIIEFHGGAWHMITNTAELGVQDDVATAGECSPELRLEWTGTAFLTLIGATSMEATPA